MRRDPAIVVGGAGLVALAVWLLIAVLQEAAAIVLRPLAPVFLWLLP